MAVIGRVCVFVLALIRLSWGDSALKSLDDSNFEHLTQAATGATTGDWLVVFSMDHEKCPECKQVEEAFEKVHEKLGHKLNVAKVWPTGSKLTHDRFEVAVWPSVYLFRHGRIYTYPDRKYDEEAFVKFVEEGFTFAANIPVPPPASAFDVFWAHLMKDIAHITSLRKNAAGVIFVAGILCGVLLNSVLGYLMSTFLQEPEGHEDGGEEEQLEGEEGEDGELQENEGSGEGTRDAEEVGWAGEEVGEHPNHARSGEGEGDDNKKTR